MENMRKIINIQAGKPVLVEPENTIKTEKGTNMVSLIMMNCWCSDTH